MNTPATTVDALQTTLAGEHAAVWVHGVLAARARGTGRDGAPPSPQDPLAADLAVAYATHRARRDYLDRTVRDLGVEPVAAAAAYVVPTPPEDADDLEAAALAVEQAATTTYAHLVAHSDAELRGWAIAALTESAARGLVFRGIPETFPGMDELAGR